MQRRRVGRPKKKEGEYFRESVKVYFTDDQYALVTAAAKGEDLSTEIRDRYLRAVTQSTGATALPLRQTAPCGQWAEILDDQSDTYSIPARLAEEWDVNERRDFILKTRGYSMLGAGIPEEAYLHMRRLEHTAPNDGDICCVVAVLNDGRALGTVKRWLWGHEREIILRDGDRKKIDVPDGAVMLTAHGKWQGNLIGRVDHKTITTPIAAPQSGNYIDLDKIIMPDARDAFEALMETFLEDNPVDFLRYMVDELTSRPPHEVMNFIRVTLRRAMVRDGVENGIPNPEIDAEIARWDREEAEAAEALEREKHAGEAKKRRKAG